MTIMQNDNIINALQGKIYRAYYYDSSDFHIPASQRRVYKEWITKEEAWKFIESHFGWIDVYRNGNWQKFHRPFHDYD